MRKLTSAAFRPQLAPIVLLTALQAAMMLSATVLYPPFQSPDEHAHVDMVLAHRHGDWAQAPGERKYQEGVLRAFFSVPSQHWIQHVGSREATPRHLRMSFDQLGSGTFLPPQPNQMVQHPPLYYGLAAGFTFLLPEFSNLRWDYQLLWLRLLSMALLLPEIGRAHV